MNYVAIIGACFVLIAVYQFATGSIALHVGKAPTPPTLKLSARGTRLFAVGLTSFGVLMLLTTWQASELPPVIRWLLAVGLIVLTLAFWWAALRTWKHDRQSTDSTLI